MQAPEWWFVTTGIFAFFGTLAMVFAIVVTIVTFRILLDIRDNIKALNIRVDRLGTKVEAITDTVKDVTTEVGARTKGITRVIDEHAGTAFNLVEKAAPILVGIAVVARIISFAKRKF